MRLKFTALAAVIVAVTLAAALVGSGNVLADEGGDHLTITPEQPAPGTEVTVQGSDFTPNAEVTIITDDLAEPLGQVLTDSEGEFEVRFELPHEMPAGVHEITATDAEGEMAAAELEVAGGGRTVTGMTDAQFSHGLIDRIPSTYEAAEIFVVGTIGAALPIVWLLIVALHLARPYMLNVLQKFSLRLGADIWWMVYLAARELLVVVGFLLSGIFLLPHLLETTELPVAGSITAAILFLVLMIKLTRDVDEDRTAMIAVTNLLGVGAAIYIGTYLLGVMGQDIITGGVIGDISDALVSTENLETAQYLSYGSLAAITAGGLYVLYYNLRIASRRASATADQ